MENDMIYHDTHFNQQGDHNSGQTFVRSAGVQIPSYPFKTLCTISQTSSLNVKPICYELTARYLFCHLDLTKGRYNF
jgi:hypothetical protein